MIYVRWVEFNEPSGYEKAYSVLNKVLGYSSVPFQPILFEETTDNPEAIIDVFGKPNQTYFYRCRNRVLIIDLRPRCEYNIAIE